MSTYGFSFVGFGWSRALVTLYLIARRHRSPAKSLQPSHMHKVVRTPWLVLWTHALDLQYVISVDERRNDSLTGGADLREPRVSSKRPATSSFPPDAHHCFKRHAQYHVPLPLKDQRVNFSHVTGAGNLISECDWNAITCKRSLYSAVKFFLLSSVNLF